MFGNTHRNVVHKNTGGNFTRGWYPVNQESERGALWVILNSFDVQNWRKRIDKEADQWSSETLTYNLPNAVQLAGTTLLAC